MAAPQAGQRMAAQGWPGVCGAVWPHCGQTHRLPAGAVCADPVVPAAPPARPDWP